MDRSKSLPLGGDLKDSDLEPLIAELRLAVEFARDAADCGYGRLTFDDPARDLWCEVYSELSAAKPQLLGAMTARAPAQVVRLSCIYALLDQVWLIEPEHLKAALAVWDYCEASCRYLFGESLGDPDADRLLRGLRREPDGLTRTEISRSLFKGHLNAARIDRALSLLERHDLAFPHIKPTKGRSKEVWIATANAKKAKEEE